MDVNLSQGQVLPRVSSGGRRAGRKSVIRLIAQKEFLELRRDGRLRWAIGLVCLLLLLSLTASWYRYAEVSAQHAAAQQSERERWLNQGEKSPHSGAHYGVYVFKPQTPLSLIDTGVEPYVGVAVHLEAHNQNIFQYKPVEDSPAARRFGELTLATTFQLLVPVLIILLGYTAFAAEREQGTLRQLLSLGTRSRDLAAGKALGTVGPLLLMLAPASIVVVVVLRLASATQASDFTRLLLLAFGYLSYFGIFIGLTLTVSALASTARQALVVLLIFWFIGCLMTPPMVMDLARQIYPNPQALEFAGAVREDRLEMQTWYRRLAEVERRLLERYGVDSPDKLPVSPKGIALAEEEAEADRMQEAHFQALHEQHKRQSRFYGAATLLAPMLALQSLSMGLSGTDYEHHRHFTEAAEQYRRRLILTMNEDDVANSKPDAAPYLPNIRGRDLWEKVPPFSYEPPPLAWALRRQLGNVAALFVWFFLVSGITVFAIKRLRAV